MKHIRDKILNSFVWLVILVTILFWVIFNIAIRANIDRFIRSEMERSVIQAEDLLSIRMDQSDIYSQTAEKYQVIIHDFMRMARQTTDVEILILGSNGMPLFPATFEGSNINDQVAEEAYTSAQGRDSIVRFNVDGKTYLGLYKEFYIDTNYFIPLLFVGILNNALQIITIVNITLIFLLVVIGLIEILLSARLSSNISKPIAAVANAAMSISKGEFTTVAIDESSLEIYELTTSINEMSNNLQAQLQQIQDLSMRDPLTGLYNKRVMREMLDREIERVNRNNLDLSILMIDVDHFKTINDRYGHVAGDLVLKRIAEILYGGIRKSDIACRFGGDEFCIILPECTKNSAYEKASSLMENVKESIIIFENATIDKITLSIGLSTLNEDGASSEELIVAADRALYLSKQSGRNKVH